jgi:hypothetical protein
MNGAPLLELVLVGRVCNIRKQQQLLYFVDVVTVAAAADNEWGLECSELCMRSEKHNIAALEAIKVGDIIKVRKPLSDMATADGLSC